MSNKKLATIGVLGSEGNNTTYYIIKEILVNSGYSYLYNSNTVSILTNGNDFLIIFELTPILAQKIMDLNLITDIIILTSLNQKDYRNPSIKRLVKNTKYLIVNIDEEESVNILSDDIEGLIVTYGQNKKATVTTSSLVLDNNIKFNLCLQRECPSLKGRTIEPLEIPVTMNLIGVSNLYHGLAAIAFGIIYGIDIQKIQSGLSNIKGIYRRLEKIYSGDYIIIDNYCGSSQDVNSVFEEIHNLKYKNIYIIDDIEENEEFQNIKSKLLMIFNWQSILNIKKVFLYVNDNNQLIIRNIDKLFTGQNVEHEFFYKIDECADAALKSLNKDDMLLILGGDSVEDLRNILKE